LLLPVDGFYRISELASASRLDLDERHQALLLHDEIDVPMAVTKAALDYTPSVSPEPTLRDPLSELPERLPGR